MRLSNLVTPHLALASAALLLVAIPALASGPGEVRFESDDLEINESAGTATIIVERKSGEDGAITVDFRAVSGTATGGDDFVETTGTLSWGDGDDDDRTFDVEIVDDDATEGDETIVLELFDPTGGAAVDDGRGTAVLIILASDGGDGGGDDDDGAEAGLLKFDEDSFEVLEEAGVALIKVERSQGEDGVVSVDYHTAPGTATEGEDYESVAGTLTWADGDGGNRTFTVPVLDDDLEEGVETIELILSNPTGGGGLHPTRSTSIVRILASDGGGDDGGGGDDDGPGVLKFDESSFEVLEGAGVAIIRVERSRGEAGEVSVDYSTSDGSATEGEDYTSVSGTLTWFAGDGTSRTFVVPILDDDLAEGDETVELTLSNPTGGAGIDDERGTAVIRILANDGGDGGDDGGDGPGVLKFDENSFEVLEAAGVAIVTVERSMGEDGVVSVEYATNDGTATDGEDYTGVSGTLTWASGDGASKTFTVPILDDDLEEADETVELSLSAPTGGAVLGQASSVVVILASDGGGGDDGGGDDGDRPGTIKLSSGTYQALENGGVAVITVERSQGELGTVSIDYTTFPGTATEGADFTGVSGTLTWTAGDGADKTFLVPVLDDDEAEGNETIDLLLSNPTGGAALDPLRDEAILTLVDDDATQCVPSANTMCLIGGRFRVDLHFLDHADRSGPARAVALSDISGLFWFFDRSNFEVLVKMVDACRDFGAYWVFWSATTNIGLDLTITDTMSGTSHTYRNVRGDVALPVQDVTTFRACS